MKLSIQLAALGLILTMLSSGVVHAEQTISKASTIGSDGSGYSQLGSEPKTKPKPKAPKLGDAPAPAAPVVAPPKNSKPNPVAPGVGGNPPPPIDNGSGNLGPVPATGQVLFDTCFSPAGGCDQKLIRFITNAKSSLDIAIYSITHTGISQAIIDAKNRGITVRMVVDKSESKGNSSQVANLVSAGIPLKIGNFSGIMHNKFTIVDGAFLETGSYNYTNNATANNGENQLYLNDVGVISRFQADFEQIFQNGLADQ